MRLRLKDIGRNRHTITVRDYIQALKEKGESILVIQHGSKYYRGKKVLTIITDQSKYVVWEDHRKCYNQ